MPAPTPPATSALASGPRYIRLVSALPGRTRLRLSWLHGSHRPDGVVHAEADRLADDLARIGGMIEVEISTYTGSVLCLHDPQRLDAAALVEHVRRLTAVDLVVGPTEAPPARAAARGEGPGVVAREVARLFKHIDDRILAATDGKLDMGTLTTFGFLGAGALNVAFSHRAPPPPWFNLAWWGIRTFMLFEADAVDGGDGIE
jgi:hypothetical protein